MAILGDTEYAGIRNIHVKAQDWRGNSNGAVVGSVGWVTLLEIGVTVATLEAGGT